MSNRTLNLTEQLYQYLLDVSVKETAVQKTLRIATQGMQQSNMQIAPEQGQFMSFLVKLTGARKCLEIGVFTGYSALSVAQALPADGKIIACDVNQEWTDMARTYWRNAGVEKKIDLRIAPAVETLQQLLDDGGQSSFDFAFIDADKTNYDRYYELTLRLLRSGGLIVIDNTLWGGDVADIRVQDEDTRAIRELNKKILHDRRADMTLLPVADGLTLVRKL
ncbi:MAG TPA: class I SAM-dependent methyltransferase [Gammaproteobacteria bacterium]|nr:class I SAM-dependent methyltransferase [Gammaproteobacteria bacterium]